MYSELKVIQNEYARIWLHDLRKKAYEILTYIANLH